jgi:(S)-ureidoglycine aminohydrolase
MRPADRIVHSRARVRQRYALFPLEGFPDSRLPSWPDALVKVLAAPALGAQFVQYLIDLPAGTKGKFAAESEIETFHYVVSGTGQFRVSAGVGQALSVGSFGLTPPGAGAEFAATDAMRLIILRKRWQAAVGIDMYKGLYGNEKDVQREVWADNPRTLLQKLIPDELAYDLAMNVFSFDPGFGLPVVETHVMEHGIFLLQGRGIYYLDDTWMEVEKDDFIWLAPYCPQSFYATGTQPAKYIYYKNVNRDISL